MIEVSKPESKEDFFENQEQVLEMVHYIGDSFGVGLAHVHLLNWEWSQYDISHAVNNIMLGQKLLTVPFLNSVTANESPVKMLMPEHLIHCFKFPHIEAYFSLLLESGYFSKGKCGYVYSKPVCPDKGQTEFARLLAKELQNVEIYFSEISVAGIHLPGERSI
jgi:hypothetical protein